MRTEAQVVADVIVELTRRQLITKAEMPGVLRALQVPLDLVRERAVLRDQGEPYPRPSGAPPAPPRSGRKPGPKPRKPDPADGPPPPAPRPRGPIAPYERKRRRPHQVVDGTEWLWCNRCPTLSDDELEVQRQLGLDPSPPQPNQSGHWAPATSFRIKPTRAGSESIRRMPYCVEGHRRYMRERRVTAAAVEDLKRIGVVLMIDADSSIIGLSCAECGEPFAPNDSVDVRGEPYHVTCRP